MGQAEPIGLGSGPPGVRVHPLGICESRAVGEGTRIGPFARVLPGAKVGRDCDIADGAVVAGGVILGDRVIVKYHTLLFDLTECEDDVFLAPNVVFTNDPGPRAFLTREDSEYRPTYVRLGATLGAGAVVVCGTTIGRYALVGAGAVVTRDVAAHALVTGNPARPAGWVCVNGHRLDADLTCPRCHDRYALVSPAEGLRRA